MNRVKPILAMLKRSLPLRGEQSWFAPGFGIALIVLLISLVGLSVAADKIKDKGKNKVKKNDPAATRSTTIALTSDETRVVVINREANSVSIIRVKTRMAMMLPQSWSKSALARNPAA